MKTIAVLGLSPKLNRPSYAVAEAMQDFGYPHHSGALLDDGAHPLKAPALWIQEGIVNQAAAERARMAGIVGRDGSLPV